MRRNAAQRMSGGSRSRRYPGGRRTESSGRSSRRGVKYYDDWDEEGDARDGRDGRGVVGRTRTAGQPTGLIAAIAIGACVLGALAYAAFGGREAPSKRKPKSRKKSSSSAQRSRQERRTDVRLAPAPPAPQRPPTGSSRTATGLAPGTSTAAAAPAPGTSAASTATASGRSAASTATASGRSTSATAPAAPEASARTAAATSRSARQPAAGPTLTDAEKKSVRAYAAVMTGIQRLVGPEKVHPGTAMVRLQGRKRAERYGAIGRKLTELADRAREIPLSPTLGGELSRFYEEAATAWGEVSQAATSFPPGGLQVSAQEFQAYLGMQKRLSQLRRNLTKANIWGQIRAMGIDHPYPAFLDQIVYCDYTSN